MKSRFIILLAIASLTIACKEQSSVENTTQQLEEKVTRNITSEEAVILIGSFTRDTLESGPYNSWFMQSYKDHSLDKETVAAIKEHINDVNIAVFMGTWCEDSQREVPAFFKILDEISYESDSVKVITISEEKDEPAALIKNNDITNVPTFIFTKDGKELGRIVEYPLESLEKDMLKILSGEEYKHAYETE